MEVRKQPLVTIAVAVYNPNMDWLAEQLASLNRQTYPNLRLIAIDDCSPAVGHAEIRACFAKHITAFPWELQQNENNLGSTKTFEKLTALAGGKYIAYCDQDDSWLPEKTAELAQALEATNAPLACCDMFVIDGAGKKTADSITQVRRRYVFKSGSGLAKDLLFRNFATGCAMLVRAETAKAAIPFCPYMVHDHYLALYSANQGEIVFVDKPLLNYRIHGANQTGPMSGVNSKADYRRLRIEPAVNRLHWLRENLVCGEALGQTIEDACRWTEARKDSFEGRRGQRKTIWEYRGFEKSTACFEVTGSWLPNALFMVLTHLIQKNVL